MIPVPPIWVFDLECYRDYFLIALKNVYSRQIESYEFYPGIEPDYERIKTSLTTKQLISFSGINYDIPLLRLFFANNDNATLKKASDAIIVENMRPWELETMYGGADFHPDHIDLIEVAPGMVGLKLYGGRMHSQRLQDLPIDPAANITPADRPTLKDYCINDLNTTIDMYFQLKPQIDLRVAMSAKYDIDLRSKSDAQIAEAVIRQEVQKKVGRKIYRPDISPDYTFKYRIPEFVSFTAPGMQKVLEIIRNATFTINEKGSVELPQIFESMRICIGSGTYTMGIGGLHSNESCSSHVSNESVFLKDRDVTSYYPSIILNQSLYPAHMGEAFLEVYQGIVSQRIEAKRTGDKVTNEAMKIMINGSFGKFGSKWSVLYSPDLLIQTAVTGYDSSLISSTNNPITAGVDYLQNWFGTPTGGSNIALFIPKSEKSLYKALPDFVPIQYQHVHPGVNTATVIIPGVDERLLRSSWEVIGTCNGTIVCSWAQIPATYGLMVHLDDDGPLKERMDLLTTKLGRGLQLVAKDMDDIVKKQTWRRRFGLGCGNRLNGYVYQNIQTVTTSGSTAAGSTSISLTAGLTTKLPIGTTFNFGTVSSPIWAVLTTAAAASDTSLTVAATSAIIADATKSTYGTPAAYQ